MEIIDIQKLVPDDKEREQGTETMVVDINGTELVVEYGPQHQDIRVNDGESIVKVRLNSDASIRDILQDDRFVSPE